MKNVDEFFAAFGGDFYLQKYMELENSGRLRRQFWLKNLENVDEFFRRLRRRFWMNFLDEFFRRFAAILDEFHPKRGLKKHWCQLNSTID